MNIWFVFFLHAQQTDPESDSSTSQGQTSNIGPKRLHVSNIPFRFREADLKNLLGVSALSN